MTEESKTRENSLGKVERIAITVELELSHQEFTSSPRVHLFISELLLVRILRSLFSNHLTSFDVGIFDRNALSDLYVVDDEETGVKLIVRYETFAA